MPLATQRIRIKRRLLQYLDGLFDLVGFEILNELDGKKRALYDLVRLPQVTELSLEDFDDLIDLMSLDHILNFVSQSYLVSLLLKKNIIMQFGLRRLSIVIDLVLVSILFLRLVLISSLFDYLISDGN